MNLITTPADILADTQNQKSINGVTIRKGTMAAFLKNLALLESGDLNHSQKREVLIYIKSLVPALKALNLHQYVTFKNMQIEKIFH